MTAGIIQHRPVPGLRGLAVFGAVAANLLLFVPFYLPGALATLHRYVAIDLMSPAILGVVFGMFHHSVFFSQPGRYLLACVAGAALLLATLLLARPGRIASILLGTTLLGVLAIPWVYGYRPAVSPAPGYRMLVPTQPGLLDGVTKRAQQFAEVRPCSYSLIGWTPDDALYYREECEGAAPQLKAIWPGREDRPRVVEGTPPEASAGTKVQAAELVRSPAWVIGADGRLVESAEAERSSIRLKLREGGLASAGGEWVALVARHIYGPEDVLFLRKDSSAASH